MKSVESISRSQSSTAISNTTRKQIINGEYAKVDKIFPVMDEMLKYAEVPDFLDILLVVYLFIQLIAISLWPAFSFDSLTDAWDDQVKLWILKIAFMSEMNRDETKMLTSLIVQTVLIAVLIIIMAYEMGTFYSTKKLIKGTLTIAKIAFDLIPILCLLPAADWAGVAIKYGIRLKQSIYYVHAVVAIIYWLIFIGFHYISSTFMANSPYLSKSPTACWLGSFRFFFMLIASVILFVSYLLDFFQKYYSVILIVFKLLYNTYMTYQVNFFPFSHLYMNEVFGSMFAASSFLDILEIVSILSSRLRPWICVLVFLIAFAIGYPILRYALQKRIKKIVKNLSLSALETVPQEEEEANGDNLHVNGHVATYSLADDIRRKHFIRLGLDRSEAKCSMYIRVGVAHCCPLFIDWSLIKFAGEYHRTAAMLSCITQFLAFFPCETRLLSCFFNIAITQLDLSYAQRFLMYQVNIIKGLRQSSASSEVADKITSLRNKANTIIEDVQRFWAESNSDVNIYFDLYKRTRNVESLYDEALIRWPNNVRICENYGRFLIEAATDFKGGILMKHRADLIEQGKNFVIDLSFRSLVRAYPKYLKDNIMDYHGRFLQNGKKGTQSSANSGVSQMSTGTIDGVLDPSIEEEIGKSCLTYHKLRLELQNCLETRHLTYSRHLHISLFWALFLMVVCCVFYFAFFYNHYDQRTQALERQLTMNAIKYHMDGGIMNIVMLWLHAAGSIDDGLFQQIAVPPTLEFEINLQNGIDEVSRIVELGLNNMTQFMNDLMQLARDGSDVREIYPQMTELIVPSYFCKNLQPFQAQANESLKGISIRMIMSLRTLTLDDLSKVGEDDLTCQLFSNMQQEDDAYYSLAHNILETVYGMEDDDRIINLIFEIAFPVGYCLLSIIPILIYIRLNLKELEFFNEILNDLNQETKEAAEKGLLQDDQENSIVKETIESHDMKPYMLYIFGCLPVLCIIIMIVEPQLCQSTNTTFSNLINWIYLSTSRAYYAYEAVTYTYIAAALNHGLPSFGITENEAAERGHSFMTLLQSNNNLFLRGGADRPSVVSYSDVIDQYNIDEMCSTDTFKSDDHENYHCDSLDGIISRFISLVRIALEDPSNAQLTQGSPLADIFHIANTHIADRSMQTSYMLLDQAQDEISNFRMLLGVVAIVGVVLGVLILAIQWFVLERLDYAYKGALQELRHVPPLAMSSNPVLMNYILHKAEAKKIETMTPAKSVVFMSKDAVIFISKSENIEFINESVTLLLGYPPDQLLGQPLTTILPEDKCSAIYQSLEMMKNQQCALTFEKSLVAFSDDEQTIPVHITLIGITDQNSNSHEPSSFVVILRDETKLIQQRKSAEEAKAASEKLLYQILPKDIVTRLNRGETNVNFVVPSATVYFIDIVKFSQYSATLSPEEIMTNLSFYFAKYDALVHKYPLITKIKLIGDIYMAAAGLFTPDEPPVNHATQVINFCLDALQALDEVNTQLNSNLNVRIGINTNGPLIAGVMGTDKPVFDIIGDTINVASRLQSTAVPGTIQISEDTYELVKNSNFNIEKRGLIELKGKGKRMAYVVRPAMISSFFTSADDDPASGTTNDKNN